MNTRANRNRALASAPPVEEENDENQRPALRPKKKVLKPNVVCGIIMGQERVVLTAEEVNNISNVSLSEKIRLYKASQNVSIVYI